MSPVIAYRFGVCEIKLQRRVLIVGSREVPIGSKTFDLLVALIENRDRVVSREQLARAGWGHDLVSDSVLSRAVTRCRQAIGDTDHAVPRIRAYWGQGYRFNSEVEVRHGSPIERQLPHVLQAEQRAAPRLALIPSALNHKAHVHPACEALDQQLATVLASASNMVLCPADRVQELLRRISAADHLAQLQQLWSHFGSVMVLSVEVTSTWHQLSARATLVGPDGAIFRGQVVQAVKATELAQALVASVEQCLSGHTHSLVPLDLPDAFAAEAFLRASSAADQWRWHQAQRLALVVCDQAPESLSAQMLLLRTLMRTDTQAAIRLGERLLTQTGRGIAPEYLASIHIALGQTLSLHTDTTTHGGALAHLQSAVALAQSQPTAAWAARAHLAAAAAQMLGDVSSRERAASLLERAAVIAEGCGNCLLASTARSQLAYLLHHDGHITRSLLLHEPVIQHAVARKLDGPASYFFGMKAEWVRAWGELDSAQDCLDVAWKSLGRVAPEDRAQPAAYLAYVQTALSLDRGCAQSLEHALSSAPRLEDCHTRHRVHLAIALARGAFAKGHWHECKQWLSSALNEAREHGLQQMVCPPAIMWVQMALAMNDRSAVERGAQRLEDLHDSQQRVATRAEAKRARAWLALEDGRAHGAARLLAQLAVCAHESYYVYLARLDAAWLALLLGSCEQAGKFLQTSAYWAERSSTGQLTAMAMQLTQGRMGRAQDHLSRARALWRGRWPDSWDTPESVMADLGMRLPTNVLLRLAAHAVDGSPMAADLAAASLCDAGNLQVQRRAK